MRYAYSNIDRRIKSWFKNDSKCATLHKITLNGQIRSLKDVDIELDFPIVAFAGKNGCGKTTILGLAACAYHSELKAYKLKSKKKTYYTFSDFFIQTQEEIPHDGISIDYTFLFDGWSNLPAGFGIQSMQKRKRGKWTNYKKRIEKNVLYLGIERVVPQTERQVYKTYIKYFRDDIDDGWYDDVKKYVGRILGKNYSEFKIKKAAEYNLQFVKETGITYSGFNMGAGERALFELFSIIHECSKSSGATLLIIDEIELGLHEVAQRKLIEVLKEICQKHKLQILCTTHSPAILDSLPPEARFYIEKIGNETEVTKGISGDFAAGRLGEKNSNELDIFVEDGIAASLLSSLFDLELRQRVGLITVGSYSAVCRQLAAAYKHPNHKDKSIAVIDGDQKMEFGNLVEKMTKDLELSTDAEKTKFKEWVRKRILFLPGNTNPEKWIIEKAIDFVDKDVANKLGVRLPMLKQELEVALAQETHSEFYYLSNKLTLSEDSLVSDFSRLLAVNNLTELQRIENQIKSFLNDD